MRKLVISIVALAFNYTAYSQPLTLPSQLNERSATQALNTVLYGPNPDYSGNVDTLIEQADASLGSHQTSIFSLINSVRLPTYQLGKKISTCTQTCRQRLSLIEEINRKINRDVGTGVVILATDSGTKSISLFDDLISKYCTQTATTQCTNATHAAIDLWEVAGMYRSLADRLNTHDKIASQTRLDDLDKKWRSYKDDTIKLWPQEALLSSILFKQNKNGFTEPPNYKVLALRPALGLSYLSDGSPDLRPTLNLDLLGIYWWKYNGHKASKGRGLAASLVWDGEDTAYGITYHHTSKWSATLAHSNKNDVVISINFQLAYWLLR